MLQLLLRLLSSNLLRMILLRLLRLLILRLVVASGRCRRERRIGDYHTGLRSLLVHHLLLLHVLVLCAILLLGLRLLHTITVLACD